MFKRLYRQRRRFLVFWALIALGCVIFQHNNHDLRFWMKSEMEGPDWLGYVSLGLSVFILTTALAVVIIVLVPGFRRVLEVGAFSFVVLEALKKAAPLLPVDIGVVTWNYVWLFAIFYVVEMAMSRDFGRRWGLRSDLDLRRTRVIAAEPEAIWAALMPEPDAIDRHWNYNLIKVVAQPEQGPAHMEVHYRLGKFGTLVQRHHRTEWNRPFNGTYAFRPDHDGADLPQTSGLMTLHCEALGDGRCRVSVRQCHQDLGIGTWLFLVLDDALASELDGVEAVLRGRRDWSLSGWQVRKMAQV